MALFHGVVMYIVYYSIIMTVPTIVAFSSHLVGPRCGLRTKSVSMRAGCRVGRTYPRETGKLGLVSCTELLLNRCQRGLFFRELGIKVWKIRASGAAERNFE